MKNCLGRTVQVTVAVLAVSVLANCNGQSGSPAAPSVFGPVGPSGSGATVQGLVNTGVTTLSFAPAATVSGDAPGLTVEVVGPVPVLSAAVGAGGEFTITGVPALPNVILRISGVPGASAPVDVDLAISLADDEKLDVELSTDGQGGVQVVSVEVENEPLDDDAPSEDAAPTADGDPAADDDSSDDGTPTGNGDSSADDDSSEDV